LLPLAEDDLKVAELQAAWVIGDLIQKLELVISARTDGLAFANWYSVSHSWLL
jgi:hypothetical protein